MKLPISIIEYELKQKFNLLDIKGRKEEQYYAAPFLYDGDVVEDNRVYVARAEDFCTKEYNDSALFICAMEKKERENIAGRKTAIYIDCKSMIRLFNEVQRIFDKYNDWEKRMNDILAEGNNMVQSLLDLAAKTHQNMFLLQDVSFRNSRIAYHGEGRVESKWNVGELVASLGKQMDEVTMEKIKDYFPSRRQIRKVMYHSISEYETLDIPLYEGTVYIGMLSMLPYNRRFEKQDYHILEMLSKYIGYALSREVEKPGKSIGKLSSAFAALLNSKHIPKKELTKICSAVGFGENDSYVIVAIRFATVKEAEYARYLQQIIKSNVRGSVECLKENVLAIAVNVSIYPTRDYSFIEMIDRYMRHFGLQAGISNQFTNFQQCGLYYIEAVSTLSLIQSENTEAGVYFFRDYTTSYLLQNCVGKLKPEMLFTEGFQRLLEYDESAAISYIKTLQVYLDENLNSTRAAKKLFISRNTFLARYERLCAVMKEDLSDPEVRFRVEMSLRLYQIWGDSNTKSLERD